MAKSPVGFTFLTLILLFATLYFSQVVEANPIPYPAEPSQEKPTLMIRNPQNFTTYGVGGAILEFSVLQPDSWSWTYDFFYNLGTVQNVSVFLDGGPYCSFPSNSTDYCFRLNVPALGTHQLEVQVSAQSYYTTPVNGIKNVPSGTIYNGKQVFAYPIVVSDSVSFDVDTEGTMIPLPITPVPTTEPTANPTPTPFIIIRQSNSSQTSHPVMLNDQVIFFTFAAVILVLAVVSILVATFDRRKAKLNGEERSKKIRQTLRIVGKLIHR
jgi:hypothetical protein